MNPLSSLSRSITDADLTERLGWCFLHFLWQGLAIAAGLALLLRFCRKGTPELRHALCGMGLACMIAAPLITWGRLAAGASPPNPIPIAGLKQEAIIADLTGASGHGPDWKMRTLISPDHGSATNAAMDGGTAPDPPLTTRKEPTTPQPPWLRWLGWFWLTGAAFVAAWRALGLCGTAWLIRQAGCASEALTQQVTAMAKRCGLRKAPLVRITNRLMSPAVAGILRPVLLFPAAALAGLSPRELDFILAHEFAHIRRHDFLLGLLQAAVETLFFFHPAVWWISHRMGLEREHACDDSAMRVTGNRRAGATALTRLAELQLQSTLSLAPAAGGGQLLQRIRRLLEPHHPRRSSGPLMVAPLLLPGIILTLLFFQQAESQDSTAASVSTDTAAPIPLMRGSIADRNGVILAESQKGRRTRRGVSYDSENRRYPLGSLASHVVGYTQPDFDQLTPDTGSQGIEKMADGVLQAVPTVAGRAQPSVILTMDARFQQICLRALREAGVGRGSAVILDLNNGDILAMASVPNFDPNDFVPMIGKAQWEKVRADPTWPLINRALMAYPPGSTFKLITALAAGESGDWAKHFECSGSVTYGGRQFRCWTVQKALPGHGTLALPEALRRSCNCYFYQLGNSVGIDGISLMAKNFGLGEASSFRLAAAMSDFMPDRGWWERQNSGPWTEAKTANISIGQGEVQATPLQMAGVAAAIANGGRIWNPRIISQTLLNGVWQNAPLELRHDLLAEGVPPETIAAIRQAMYEVVHSEAGGTGLLARSNLLSIAGKAGISQKWRIDQATKKQVADHHTHFIGFAPFEKPRYAFSVVVANVKSGGGVCAPIAKRIMESIELLNRGELAVELKSEPPAKGHFDVIESVSYADEIR